MSYFFIFATKVHVREFFPAIFFLPILKVFYFRIFAVFFYFFYAFTEMKPKLVVLELSHLIATVF